MTMLSLINEQFLIKEMAHRARSSLKRKRFYCFYVLGAQSLFTISGVEGKVPLSIFLPFLGKRQQGNRTRPAKDISYKQSK